VLRPLIFHCFQAKFRDALQKDPISAPAALAHADMEDGLAAPLDNLSTSTSQLNDSSLTLAEVFYIYKYIFKITSVIQAFNIS
jgi:hypothetical protein